MNMDGGLTTFLSHWPLLPLAPQRGAQDVSEALGQSSSSTPPTPPERVPDACVGQQSAICPVCSEPFELTRPGRRYCSKRCRIKHNNLRYKVPAKAKGNGETKIKPGPRTTTPLPDYIERPLSVRVEEPSWLRDDLRPPPVGPWEAETG